MKISKNIFAGILGILLLSPLSCSDDFLEQTDTINVSEDVLFKKPSDGVALINSIYNTFDDNGYATDFYMKKALSYIANYLTQDFHNWGNDIFWLNYQINVNNASMKALWDRFYKGIATANSAFPIIEKMKEENVMSEELGNRLIGEAYFLRGLFYYYLGSTFGGVPLELKSVTDAGLHPRNTQDEVFAAVEADMAKAAELLPWKEDMPQSELGRATRGAALGYKGAAQMWLKKYAEAVATYNQLEGKYELMENFVDIHEFDHQNNKESLFEIQYLFPEGGERGWAEHTNDSHWMSSFGIPWEVLNSFGYEYADPKLYMSFEPGDLRKVCTVIGPGDEHPSPVIEIKNYAHVQARFAEGDPAYIGPDNNIINTCGTIDKPWLGDLPEALPRSGYYGTKFWRDPNVIDPNNTFFSDQNVILLRFGEILISKAEAQLKSGDEAGALATLQRVRDRAWGKLADPSVVVPPPPGGDVMKMIVNEYRHEVAGELSLWFVLRRSGEHIDYVLDEFGIIIPSGHDLMPIPATAIATNPTLEQNPGY